ncbi:MAG: sulfite exporter TauE/SafE family protein [Herbaspirillum sp.]|jgi:uncharacterized membrane protein YfcA|nr:sulfite exporter TauE/SafE family protein [Herbaspirillum sp.]
MKNLLFDFGIDSIAGVLTVTLTFLLAGWVKGVIGLGLPTIAVGLLGLIMTPTEAAALLIVPSFVTNAWQLAAGPALGPLSRRLRSMLIGICAGTLIGGWRFGADGGAFANAMLGIALAAYATAGLASLRLSISSSAERRLSPAIGAATGLITAASGIFVVPAVPYLQMLGLEKEELMQAMGLAFTTSTVALAIMLAGQGALHAAAAATSLLALAPALGGMFAGQWMRSKIPPALFRRCFFLALLALGAYLALHAVFK